MVSARTVARSEGSTLREVLDILKSTYCRTIGVQFMHIDDLGVKNWLQERMEGSRNRLDLDESDQRRVFTWLTDAVMLEEFIQKKYIGAKSFSLEGAESLIPLVNYCIDVSGEQGLDEITIGMAHRGRLNVLVNVLGKSARAVFHEFEDTDPQRHLGGGDVKYHLGYSSDVVTACGKKLHLSLCFNPSHLGFVGPVALGRMRAKQDRYEDTERRRGMALLIHGDAAFAGEGVTQETLNLSELKGYTTGGSIHVIVNNQVGFTTPPWESRSTPYATSVAKMLQSPIFHVNGEDPEAVCQVIKLAMEFRQTFQHDVVIDMFCFRRRGHNEGDEPAYTQPLMYRTIRARQSVQQSYLEHTLDLGVLTRNQAEGIMEERRDQLEAELSAARADDLELKNNTLEGVWKGYHMGRDADVPAVGTSVDGERLRGMLVATTRTPEDFQPHPKLERFFAARRAMAAGERPLDWAAGEALAFASLACEGTRIRLSGQDCERGTFSHRHAVLHDHHTGAKYCPLQHLREGQGPVEIINSPLSEVGVLGFEWGYSLDYPDGLILWEAQFGDFVNVAQVILDQFINSAEDKWLRLSGLVVLLPHGFEGMGPEHSSARLERFLQMSAEDCWQICNVTTPAQYFHLLRRQVLRTWRKPLILMTPKSLLRHPSAVSSLDELSAGSFQRVIGDAEVDPSQTTRILLCSGKIYYELHRRRAELGRHDVAILRIEQIYPLGRATLEALLAPYAAGVPAMWVQEEPENMGAWHHIKLHHGEPDGPICSRHPLTGIFRAASASPATGSRASHDFEQERLLQRAFDGLPPTETSQS